MSGPFGAVDGFDNPMESGRFLKVVQRHWVPATPCCGCPTSCESLPFPSERAVAGQCSLSNWIVLSSANCG